MNGHTAVGVDGCRAGWFAVALPVRGEPLFGLFSSLEDLWTAWGDESERLFIDIPIGLPSAAPRRCDIEARRLLPKGRKSSVFPVPCREAVHLSGNRTAYTRACDINRIALGRGLSRQAWNICPKIAEVDRFLVATKSARARVHESHPELVFMGLNRGRAMRWGKKSGAGREERLAVLTTRLGEARSVLETALRSHRRGEVTADDILDAMALATAAAFPAGACLTLPQAVERDALGLPMAIALPAW